ncbi:MAG: dicarboxylate/amino acid:cation symporter [Alphaproteobacteria bacterium]|nr:dicarboxylate/amino acid:cation symporter [Alphaproteobacteria bacterium]
MSKTVSPRGKSLSKSTQTIMDQKLWAKILSGMIVGIAVGLILSPQGMGLWEKDWAYATGEWLALPGIIFLGLTQMVIIPLIVCSIILGISESGDLEFLKKLGLRIIPYFILTTAISIIIGLAIVNTVKPGLMIDQNIVQNTIESGAASGQTPGQTFENLTIPQRIANIIPTNPAKAQVERNMLQIVIAAILVGIALITIPSKTGKPFRELCIAGQVISMRIISWAMAIAPVAVFGLISNITIRLGFDSLISVGAYAFSVLAGLACILLVYMLIVGIFTRTSPLTFLKNIREVQLLAFSTSSSAVTMPFSIQAAEEKLRVRPEISRFIIPLGATINMDGTALYQAVAAIFLCQVFGIDLTFNETLMLIITTLGASIGTPATPGVGLVVLATILTGIGVPPEGIALIIGVDRLLDMCRTAVNVTGDLTASKVMDKWIKE